MAKNGEFNGSLAGFLDTLERADKADRSSLSKALSMARKSGAISDEELAARFDGVGPLAFNAELGRLVVLEGTTSKLPQWMYQSQATAKKLSPDIATYDDRWQPWSLPHTPNRSRQAINGELRDKGSVAHKLAQVALQPTIRVATLASSNHLQSKAGAYASYQNVHNTLEISAAQRSLTKSKPTPFEQALAPEYDKSLFEAYTDDDVALVRTRRFMGSYTRPTSVFNRAEHAQLATTQSLNLMQQTTFALEPEWGDLLLDQDSAEGFALIEDAEVRRDLGAFIANQEVMTPLASSLHVSQRFEILRTSPA